MTQRVKVSLLLLLLAGCEPDEPDPCTVDAFDCLSDFEALPADSDCTTAAPISLELGWGDASFHAFNDTAPEVHNGLQGGQHIFAAIRASGAELDDVPALSLALYALGPVDAEACTSEALNLRNWDPASLPEDARAGDFDPSPGQAPIFLGYAPTDLPPLPAFGPSRCMTFGSERHLILQATDAQRADGTMEAEALLVQLPYTLDPEVLFVASIKDACGDAASVTQAVSLPR